MALATPSLTLYVSNLETKTKKPELRASLYALFTPYGRVVDIIAKKHAGGRGQAFVVFEDQAAATAAMRGLTGELFYKKALNIAYSKSASNATLARLDPTQSREAAAVQAAKLVVSRAQGEYEALEKEKEDEEARGAKRDAEEDADDGAEASARAGKKARTAGQPEEEEETMEIEMDEDEDDETAGTKLIATNLPPECNEAIMGALFGQYTGFTTAAPLSSSSSKSLPPSNPGAKAFTVTFSTRAEAEAALGQTKGYLMQPGWEMGVTLA